MRVSTHIFWLPKAGNMEEEYEDAFWPVVSADGVPLHGFCCAIADGATETSFAGDWAQLLTRRWCDDKGDLPQFRESLPALREEWVRRVEAVPMAWYAEEKARAGAFSSLLGIAFSDSELEKGNSAGWQAVAVGDSCLFQLSGDRLICFPLKHSEDFNSRPYLLSTVSLDAEELNDEFLSQEGTCIPGDVFYLMTDALACWFLRRHEEGQADSLFAIDGPEVFKRIVDGQRAKLDAEGRPYLRNDDVTLLRLEITE